MRRWQRSAVVGMILAAVLLGGRPVRLHAEVLDRIVAVVNDEPITQRELEELMLPFFVSDEQKGLTRSSREIQEASAAALRQLIDERVVVQAARKAKIEASEADVQERLRQVRGRFPTDEAFAKALAEEGITQRDLLRRFREQVISRKLIDKEVRAHITVSPVEAEQYYAAHAADFSHPEEVRARHILIRVSAERTDADAAKLADDIHQKLLATQGADVAHLAKTFSQAPEADQGGDLGWVTRGQLKQELDEPLFALPLHGISPPIHTNLGYHLLFVEDKHEAGRQLLEEARTQVEDRLYTEKFKQAVTVWMNKLREQAYIQVM